MSRKIVENPDFIAGGNWLKFEEVQTAAGPREFVRRRNGQYEAVKILPIIFSPDADVWKEKDETVVESVRSYGVEKFSIFVLAADRPITYFETPGIPLTENYVYELPGGIMKKHEKIHETAVRELLEEAPPVDNVKIWGLQCLVPACAYDGGTHLEWYSIYAALYQGVPAPKAREGIIPEKCLTLPLIQARDIFLQKREEGIAVEGYVFAALDALRAQMHVGWGKTTLNLNIRI